jgi:uncharacterized protein YjbI with pentapeptide repeats
MNIEELKKTLAQHKLWMESTGKDGERATFIGADLRDADLGGTLLEGVNL